MKNARNPWNLSDEFLTDSAGKRADSGDDFGALTILNKRAGLYPPSADAWAIYAEIYEHLELWHLAADAWFRFLDVCNEADFGEGYEGLAIAFLNMGNDFQSAYFYSRAFPEEETEDETEELAEFLGHDEPSAEPPKLHLVGEADPETLREGLDLMRRGELEEARERFLLVDADSPDHPSAAGLAAMCLLMMEEEEQAERECEELLAVYPDNTQVLTTYIAVLGARGERKRAREIAKHLASLPADATDELYRIATALCETGLDEEAYRVLTELKKRLPYDENVLFFSAAAGYKLGKLDEAISSLETLTSICPRKAVAQYYLEHLRMIRDGDETELEMGYFYRMPQKEYRRIANCFLAALRSDTEDMEQNFPEDQDFEECFRLAFDELEGRDEKIQMVAVKAAARAGYDDLLREILLDYTGNDFIKFSILHEVTVRNENNSFGTVFLNMYREFFTHSINIGPRKAEEFLDAFADVYSKYGLLGEDNEGKICGAAEDIYAAVEDAGAWKYMNERAALASAIYREARISGGIQPLSEICDMFDANRYVTQEILDLLM